MTINEITMQEANQIMYDAIKRWQRARKEILAYQYPVTPALEDEEKLKKLLEELANAEDYLMDI